MNEGHDMLVAAAINARVARALIKMEAMKAENKRRELTNQTLAYLETAFMSIIDEEISDNSIIRVIHGESY